MKSFLFKVFLFYVIYLAIIQIPRRTVSPYYANEYFKIKYDYYKQHENNFNTVFIGSSRTFRHIVPHLYDSLLADYHISSFNLGMPGTFNPETYYLFDQVLENAGDSLKYVIIDMQPLSYIDAMNLNVPSSYYWHNPEYWSFAMKYIVESTYTTKRKLMLAGGYTASLLINYNKIPDYKTLKGRSPEITRYWLGYDKRGYFSLDDNLKVSGGDSSFQKRNREFLADTMVLLPRIQAATKNFETTDHSNYLNRVHLEKVQSMIKRSEQKGIHLVFLISGLAEDYTELLALKEKLPDGSIIEIADYNKFPELYKSSMIFDVGHFNAEGSRLFSSYLAQGMRTKFKNVYTSK